jgi:protein-arginine deiminase
LSPTHFAAPKPFGPIINGEDIFEKSVRDSLAAVGVEVTFIDDWSMYHVNDGEVHCGTNTIRTTSGAAAWWEAL